MIGFPKRAGLVALMLALAASPGLTASGGGSSSGGGSTSGNSQKNAAVATYADAQALVDQGKYNKALKVLRAMTKANPSDADAWNLMGYSSRKLKKYDDASVYYAKALKLDPKHLGALEYQGELFVETGAYTQAKANLKLLKSLCGKCEQYAELKTALTAAGQS